MKEVGPYLCEVMFALSVENHDIQTLKVTGAHFKTNGYGVRDDGSTMGHSMSGAQPLDLANPAELALINPLNAAVIGELNDVKAQLSASINAAELVQKEYNSLIVTHNDLLAQNTQTLAQLDGTRINLEKANADLEALEKESEQVHLELGVAHQKTLSLEEELHSALLREEQLVRQIELLKEGVRT